MIYQHIKKRTKILPLANSHSRFYATGLIMFALPISIPRYKSIFFYLNSPKIKLFLQKNAKLSSAGGSDPKPQCLRRLVALPQTLKTAPSLQISGDRQQDVKGFILFKKACY